MVYSTRSYVIPTNAYKASHHRTCQTSSNGINHFETMMEFLSYFMLCGILVILYVYARNQRKYGHIPGPRKLPIIGNMLHFMQRDNNGKMIPFQQQVTNLSRKYGGVMWINIGCEDMIVASSYEAMYDALVKKSADFADKVITYRTKLSLLDKSIGGMCNTPTHRDLKTIIHRALRVYGENVDHLEHVVKESLEALAEKLNEKMGQPVVVKEIFMEAFANTIHIMVFGRQFEPSKTTYSSLIELYNLIGDALSKNIQGLILDNIPAMRFVFRRIISAINQWVSTRQVFWTELIRDHKENWDGEEQRCLLDMLLKHQAQMASSHSPVQLSDEHILLTLDNIFVAGFLPSYVAMSGIILQCIHNPKLQDRIYSEVCSVVGPTGIVSIRHKNELHYTRAVIFEALRIISVSPLGVHSRLTSRDTSLGDYFIPKGTQVVLNQWALHHDRDFWHEPWSFQPERFLNKDGTLVSTDHPNRLRLMPFSAGERVCVAQVFALNRLCMFLAALIQRFRFQPDDAAPPPSADPRTWGYDFVMRVPLFKTRFVAHEYTAP